MKQYITLDKRSKKAQKEYYAKQRRTWGELNPVTRSVPSGKVYNRKKEKQRIGGEFRNGFGAGFLCKSKFNCIEMMSSFRNFYATDYFVYYTI